MTLLPKLSPEMLVPRLGEYLVKRGNLTEADLQKALSYQQERLAAGQPSLLGQALIDLGLIDRVTLDQAVTEQIVQLRNALQESNRTLERRVQERTAELQEALRRLAELNQMKANFTANISHELRTPLTHIKGYLELLASNSLGTLANEQVHAVQVSQRAAARLEGLIEDLILFSLAARGELSIKLEAIELRRLIGQSVKAAASKAEDRGVSLHAVVEDDLPLVKADAQKLSWVFNQLLDNAIKFTNQGGRVVISARRESAGMVGVTVTDTGIGIPPERIEEIFEPFHQLDASATRRYGGTGLGLALVRQIIEAHGSLIQAQSIEGRGSTFAFPLLIAEKQT